MTYLSDVDDGFYAANYLRAWALETHLRRHLRERFGERVVRASARRATCCARCGERVSGSTPTSCGAQSPASGSTSRVMIAEV